MSTNMNINTNIYNNKLCFFDLETTGLATLEESIVQFGACDLSGQQTFLKYCYPSNKKSNLNSEIHGITKDILITNNAQTTKEILLIFIDWVNDTFGYNNIYLIAHNCFNFDLLILEKEFHLANLNIPNNWYFVDSLLQFKKYNPEIGYGNYSLSKLFNLITNTELVNAHNALVDSIALSYVYYHLTTITFNKHSFENYLNLESYKAVIYLDLKTLPLTYINGILKLKKF